MYYDKKRKGLGLELSNRMLAYVQEDLRSGEGDGEGKGGVHASLEESC